MCISVFVSSEIMFFKIGFVLNIYLKLCLWNNVFQNLFCAKYLPEALPSLFVTAALKRVVCHTLLQRCRECTELHPGLLRLVSICKRQIRSNLKGHWFICVLNTDESSVTVQHCFVGLQEKNLVSRCSGVQAAGEWGDHTFCKEHVDLLCHMIIIILSCCICLFVALLNQEHSSIHTMSRG